MGDTFFQKWTVWVPLSEMSACPTHEVLQVLNICLRLIAYEMNDVLTEDIYRDEVLDTISLIKNGKIPRLDNLTI